ncbi:MAG: oligosaccharide flippase family protein, partial [Candidatus Thorarchaeota archaeon]
MSTIISVIIPVYNGERTIDRCLKACLNQTKLNKDNYEIIVVDNASNDSTPKIIKKFAKKYNTIRYFYEPKRSSYAARNKGINEATGKYLIFTDIDNVPDTSWLTSYLDLCKKLEHKGEKSFLIGGAVEVKIQDKKNAYEIYDKLNFLDQERLVKQESFGVTANLLVERGVFESVGHFDPDLISGGDREFGYRAIKKFKLYYSSKAKVTHFARNNFKEIMNKNYRIAIGFAQEHYKLNDTHIATRIVLRHLIPNLGYLNKELFTRLTVKTSHAIPTSIFILLKLLYIDIFSRYFQFLGRVDGKQYITKKKIDSLKHRVVKGGFWVFSVRAIQQVFNIIRLIVLARVLAPDDFGVLGIALLVMMTLETFTQTGFQHALIQKKKDIRPYLDAAWTVLILRGIILFSILFLIAPFAAGFFETSTATTVIQVIGFSVLFQAGINIGVVYFQKELEFKKYFIFQISGTLADFIIAISAAIILKNVWALVFGLVGGNAVRFIVSYFIHPYKPRF